MFFAHHIKKATLNLLNSIKTTVSSNDVFKSYMPEINNIFNYFGITVDNKTIHFRPSSYIGDNTPRYMHTIYDR